MKRGPLLFWTWTIVMAVAGLALLDFLVRYWADDSLVDGDVLAGVMGVGAGALAILFQRRAEFVDTMRAEWALCLDALAEVRALYTRTTPDEDDYLRAYTKVWAAIDGMRSVYRDHGESGNNVGYYPFATLHDIRLMLEHDFARHEIPEMGARMRRLEQIEDCWRLFRYWYLSELDTPEAGHPVLTRLTRDERAMGVSWWGRHVRRLPPRRLLADEDLAIPQAPSPETGAPSTSPPPAAEGRHADER